VAADKQGENRYYKLRFRQGSKQCVRYLVGQRHFPQ
jgi:hypothetical protein